MEIYIPVRKQARISVAGDPYLCKQVWVVCHGYGQLSKFFIRKFQCLASKDVCIIAPEGLHRFYKNGYSGRVGASWMTSEERERDISDYIDYLDDVTEHLFKNREMPEIVGLGFSQGAATISRWAALGRIKPKHLVLWSSVFPPDLPAEKALSGISEINFVYGDQDEFLAEQDFIQHAEALRQMGFQVREYPFKGIHDIDERTLLALQKELKSF